jgi:hypothetical protein
MFVQLNKKKLYFKNSLEKHLFLPGFKPRSQKAWGKLGEDGRRTN